MAAYTIGDTVIIKEHKEFDCGNDCAYATFDMRKLTGKTATIKNSISSNRYYLDIDKQEWHWSECMLSPYTESMDRERSETPMQDNFQIGDIIELKPGIKDGGCGNMASEIRAGNVKYVEVRNIRDDGNIGDYNMLDENRKFVRGYCCSISNKYFQKVTSANTLMTRIELTESQKNNLSKNAKALVEAGFYTSSLELNSQDHFMKFLLQKFEGDYASFAIETLAKDDAEKAKVLKAQAAVNAVK